MAADPPLFAAATRAAAHPVKLAVDVLALATAMVPLWSHRWLLAALVAIVPGLIATLVLAVAGTSGARRALATWVQLVRIAALAIAVWAAWTHQLGALIGAVA